jgi:hypothetical protein
MILESLNVTVTEFERGTGWVVKPEGACKGELCVPLPAMQDGRLDVRVLAARLGMPLVEDGAHGLWCLGPEAGGRALSSAVAPELTLPDVHGREFRLSSLRGRKVLLVAWASW